MPLLGVVLPVLVLILASCEYVGGQDVFLPYEPGSHTTTKVHIGSLLTPGLEENLDVWLPTEGGTYNVFYFLDGMGAVTPANFYAQTMKHIASHGIAVVVVWKMSGPLNPEDKVPIFASVLEWAEEHLEKRLHNSGVEDSVHLDLENLVLGGHSAGNHILVEYLKGTCGKVKGQVFISPVDGADPFGLLPIYCINPRQSLNYITPTLHLAAGLDSLPGFSGIACAPEDLSNDRFYQALDPSSQRWSINATEFGHADFLDPPFAEAVGTTGFCSYNNDATAEEFSVYRRFVAGQTVTFIKALLEEEEGDCGQYLPYLEDTTLMPVAAEERHVNDIGGCPVAGCSWTPETIYTGAL
ncbi:uncharacterized protein [Panulirus ornatus]|uniref:uncharacterized protein n=1 Tax=Panulirus ornatus TaxID=150431 RepID=UPI003A868506